jgi:four helix bundle protein
MEFGFEKLDVWQKAASYYVKIYELAWSFPRSEFFGQTAQLKKSALSISLNIAEGHGRSSKKDFQRFLSYARGSVFETVSNLIVAYKRGFISKEIYDDLYKEAGLIARMISSLINKFKPRLLQGLAHKRFTR